MNSALFPRATVIREGIDSGKVLVEFGPKGPFYLVSDDGSTEPRLAPYSRTTPQAAPLAVPSIRPFSHPHAAVDRPLFVSHPAVRAVRDGGL